MHKTEKIIVPDPRELNIAKSFFANHRKKLLNMFTELKVVLKANSILFFRGIPTIPIHDQDIEFYPDQEMEADFYGMIETNTGKTTLFCPYFPKERLVWIDAAKGTPEYYKKFYEVDEVVYCTKIEEKIRGLNPEVIYIHYGEDSSSGLISIHPEFGFMGDYEVNKEDMYDVLNECRVIKDQTEIEILAHINKVSSEAHVRIMRSCRPGLKEYQLESLYKFHNLSEVGSRFVAHEHICASGQNASTLFYNRNNKIIQNGELILADLGSKYYGYNSDIATTFPANGKFTEKQKIIYNAALNALIQVKSILKPGIKWADMQELGHRVILQVLQDIGIIHQNYSLDELISNNLGSLFMPHKIGHYLGLRVHDVGALQRIVPTLNNNYQQRSATIPKIIQSREQLQAGMCITIEPGCYFIKKSLEKAYANPVISKYLNPSKIQEFNEVPGVRLEDDVIITENGYTLLTHVPRTVEQIEACMRGENWELI